MLRSTPRLYRKLSYPTQFWHWNFRATKVYSDVSRHIKNVPIASHDTFDRFSGKKKSRIRFGYGRSDTHFLECRIDFSNRQLTLNSAFQSRQLPQSTAIVAIDESVDGNSWELPVL